MSSDNPPYPYYNGIPFNPSFFTSTTDTGSGLTETAANALYLRKTVTDTATALETFNEGIVTPSISSTGSLIIATEASAGTVNIGSGENILSIEGLITSINESGAQQTNIGTNVVGSSTNINSRTISIANGTNFNGTVNIMNGEASAGTINIGKDTVFPLSYTDTNIRGRTSINDLTLSAPITSAYTVVPTSGQLGFVPTAIFNAGDPLLQPNNFTLTAFTNVSVAKIELTAGTWIITGMITANSCPNTGSVVCALTPALATFSQATDYFAQCFNSTYIVISFLATRIVQVTSTQFYYLTARAAVADQVINSYKLTATRIA